MQFSGMKALGDAIGFGSAFLFASVFGMFHPICTYIFTKSGSDIADPPVRSGIRLYNTRKLVPSGLLSALSLGALGVFYAAYLQDKV